MTTRGASQSVFFVSAEKFFFTGDKEQLNPGSRLQADPFRERDRVMAGPPPAVSGAP